MSIEIENPKKFYKNILIFDIVYFCITLIISQIHFFMFSENVL